MATINYTYLADDHGNKLLFEELNFENNTLDNGQKVETALFSSGEWIGDFLSLSLEESDRFLNDFNFTEEEKKDCVYAHTIFNHFLRNKRFVLYPFQVLLAKNNIALPSVKHEIDFSGQINEVYYTNNITELCAIIMLQLIKRGQTIKECANCHRWFVPKTKNNEKYCQNQSPQYKEKNCREAAHYLQVINNRHSDESIRLKKNIRQMLYYRFWDASAFNKKNKNWEGYLKAGMITEQEYITLLKSQYKRKYPDAKVEAAEIIKNLEL
jgi:hypothetical protein